MHLDIEKIQSKLNSTQPHWNVVYLDEVDSTNRWLMDQAMMDQTRQAQMHRCVCLARQQTAGVGRSGKPWRSGEGENIIMSLGYAFELELAKLPALSLVSAIAIVDVLESFDVQGLSVKWPNDVYLNGAKLAGILLQTQKQLDRQLAVIGLGINVQLNQTMKTQIARPAADLASVGINLSDRELIIVKLLKHLDHSFQRFQTQGFASFLPRWNQLDFLKDQAIELDQSKERVQGVCAGVNEQGALLLNTEAPEPQAYFFGEAQVLRMAQ